VDSPQRMWLRRALFQIHLWVGVAFSIYAIAIGLSGSALVFRDEIEHAMWPDVFHVTPVARTITMQTAIDQIQASRRDWVIFAIRDFNTPGQATTAMMRPAIGKLSANYRQVYFNPFTGEVLLDRLRYGGWLGWLANLHEYLLVGSIGLIISGWMAVGMLVLCVTGIVLWWPGIQRWVSALKINPRAQWKRLNWELHSMVGFWTCASLLVVSFTGVGFAFPDTVDKVVTFAMTGSFHTDDAASPATGHASEIESLPVMNLDQAMEAIRAALPRKAPAGYLQLPAKRTGAVEYKATGYYLGSLPYSELVRVSIDARTGAVLSYTETRNESRSSRVQQYFTTVHFGSFGGNGVPGIAVKSIWVLIGIAPALLAVTGLIMYWNRGLRPWLLRLKKRRTVQLVRP
jgi:uncharacterized iron-regulated membrane protein